MATIFLTITEGTLTGDGRGNFEIEDLPVLLSPREYEDFLREKNRLQAADNQGNFSETYEMTIIGKDGYVMDIQFYLQRASSPLVRARFISKRGAFKHYDYQPYLRANFHVGNVLRLDEVGPKRFQIV